MGDIFISYARADRRLAESLARDLASQGYSVWWDAELVGADDFYEVILEAIKQAKAAIVIWSNASARSRFVRDEARFAMHSQKLIAVRAPGLDIFDIPFGFQGQHTDDVNDRAQIFRAISKLGVVPAAFASSSDRGRGITPTANLRADTEIELTKDNWQAFFYGITLRIPKFQLSEQGTWTSIGAAIAYIVISLIAAELPVLLADESMIKFFQAFVFVVMAIFLWMRAGNFLTQRNLLAAIILCLASTIQAALATRAIIEFVIPWNAGEEDKLLYFAVVLTVYLNLTVLRVRAYR